MGLLHTGIVVTFKALTRAICRVDDAQLEKIPDGGPLILVGNHVHIVEMPLNSLTWIIPSMLFL